MSKSKKEDADLKFATKVRAVFGTGNVQKRQDAFSEFRETQTEFVEDAFPSLLGNSVRRRRPLLCLLPPRPTTLTRHGFH